MLNKKGFVLVETLVVAVFSAIIFAFLYASIIPLNGIYEVKTSQEDNVNTYYAAYNIRNFLYNDIAFRKMMADDANDENYYLNYTYITCDSIDGSTTSMDDSLKNIFITTNNSDYCNELMSQVGLRRSVGNIYKDYYRLIYIKGTSREGFLDVGVSLYRSFNKQTTSTNTYEVSTYNVDIEDTIVDALRNYTVDDFEEKSYLLVYDIYNDSIAIIEMVRHDTLDDCFTYQFISNYTGFYKYDNLSSLTTTYNYFIFNTNKRRYENLKIISDDANCAAYFENKGISNPSDYCAKKFNRNFFDYRDINAFVTSRFAKRINDDYDDLDVAIIKYDSSCSTDITIPDQAFGKNVTVIGYDAFKNIGVTSITMGNNVRIIDEHAFDNHRLTAAKVNELRTIINNNGILDLSGI